MVPSGDIFKDILRTNIITHYIARYVLICVIQLRAEKYIVTVVQFIRAKYSQLSRHVSCPVIIPPHSSKVDHAAIRCFGKKAYIDGPSVEIQRSLFVDKANVRLDVCLDRLSRFCLLNLVLVMGYDMYREINFTFPIIFTDTLNFGKSATLPRSFIPKGGFLLNIMSTRWASVASRISTVLIPAFASFLTATTPI